MYSSGASPLKRPGRETLASISKENLQKFEISMRERSYKVSLEKYGDQFLRQYADKMHSIGHNGLLLPIDFADIYPRFVLTNLEKNLATTNNFYENTYRNTRNT